MQLITGKTMKSLRQLFIIVTMLLPQSLYAGIYTDDLSRCLVEKSTTEDKLALVKWMFTAMSLHPAVQNIATVSSKQRDVADKAMADLMVNLLSVECLEQSKKAIKYEGETAIQSSFKILGEIAAKELFANPEVAKGLSSLDQYIDSETLNARLGIKQ